MVVAFIPQLQIFQEIHLQKLKNFIKFVFFFLFFFFPSLLISKKIKVGFVAIVCTLAFTMRSILTFLSAFVEFDFHWGFLLSYYLVTEIIPSWLVFYTLRKLPPKREDLSASRFFLLSFYSLFSLFFLFFIKIIFSFKFLAS